MKGPAYQEKGLAKWQLDVSGWQPALYQVQVMDAHGNRHQRSLTVK